MIARVMGPPYYRRQAPRNRSSRRGLNALALDMGRCRPSMSSRDWRSVSWKQRPVHAWSGRNSPFRRCTCSTRRGPSVQQIRSCWLEQAHPRAASPCRQKLLVHLGIARPQARVCSRKPVNSAEDISPTPIANSRWRMRPEPQTWTSMGTL
jgi:hypothetical protein